MKTKFLALVVANVLFFSCSKTELEPSSSEQPLKNYQLAGGGTCTPISSYTVKGDYRAGETGVSTIDVAYAVKPCDKNQTVNVKIEIIKFDTKAILAVGENLELSGKYHFAGVGLYGIYTAKMTVTDSVTGAVVATNSFSVALVPKRV